MKKLLLTILSAAFLVNMIYVPQVDAASVYSLERSPSADRLYEEPDSYRIRGPIVVKSPVYTTLSMGNDFLYQLNNYDSALKALEIYKNFEAGISTQGFNFANLAKQNNMIESGRIIADVNQGSDNVGYVITQFNSLFKNKLNCILDSNTLNIFTNTIQSGFNVDTSTRRSYLIFTKKSGSSYTYLFKLLAGSLQNINGKMVLTMVPTDITVNVNISIKKIFGITIKKKKHYDVHINAYSYVYNLN